MKGDMRRDDSRDSREIEDSSKETKIDTGGGKWQKDTGAGKWQKDTGAGKWQKDTGAGKGEEVKKQRRQRGEIKWDQRWSRRKKRRVIEKGK